MTFVKKVVTGYNKLNHWNLLSHCYTNVEIVYKFRLLIIVKRMTIFYFLFTFNDVLEVLKMLVVCFRTLHRQPLHILGENNHISRLFRKHRKSNN